MKNIILILVLSLSTFCFGQSLLDTINFESINQEFLNKELFDMINTKRYIYGKTNLIKSDINSEVAKYHTDYFTIYRDTSTFHSKEMKVVLDSTKGKYYYSKFVLPKDRFYGIPFMKGYDGVEQDFVGEISKILNLSSELKVTYKDFIDMILEELIFNDESKLIMLGNQVTNNHLGLSNNLIINQNRQVEIIVTLVMGSE
jgi:hypothetical protein